MSDWVKVQETTFTRWVNSSLRGHLTSNQNRVSDLRTDLKDGRNLALLLEKMTKKKLNYMREDRQLKFKPQYLENLGVSFRFMEQEHIKLVNIGKGKITWENFVCSLPGLRLNPAVYPSI